ncbi:hypothetical protein ACT1U9_10675 [Streptomyces sp. BR1]|uniref:hypothetical protein n=1 Tax=Streptomyces sp. BR1 TaxID=1592323 RepID=UPI00402B9BB9
MTVRSYLTSTKAKTSFRAHRLHRRAIVGLISAVFIIPFHGAAVAAEAPRFAISVENGWDLKQCSVVKVTARLTTPLADESQHIAAIEVRSGAIDGGSAKLPGKRGVFEGYVYLSHPPGDYAVSVISSGVATGSTPIRITAMAQGAERRQFPYAVDPDISTEEPAIPGGPVEVSVADEAPDPQEKYVTVTSEAFVRPVNLEFNGRHYIGRGRVRDDAKPGKYTMQLTSHFGCGEAMSQRGDGALEGLTVISSSGQKARALSSWVLGAFAAGGIAALISGLSFVKWRRSRISV